MSASDKIKIKDDATMFFDFAYLMHELNYQALSNYYSNGQENLIDTDFFINSIIDCYSLSINFKGDAMTSATWSLQQHIEKTLKKIIVLYLDENKNDYFNFWTTHQIGEMETKVNTDIIKEYGLCFNFSDKIKNLKPSVRYGENVPSKEELYEMMHEYIEGHNNLFSNFKIKNKLTHTVNTSGVTKNVQDRKKM